MRNKKYLFILLFCSLFLNSFAQKSILWLSYGQSKFLYSPGVEYAYFFTEKIAVQMAVNSIIQDYDPKMIVNYTSDNSFSFLHNFNFGLSSKLFKQNDKVLGVSLGAKMYYGADFRVLHYYQEGDYNIYYDSFRSYPVWGIDFGLFYSVKRLSTLIKYDTARGRIRLGVGFNFGYEK